jgi:DNA-binding Lrp family transcriptional regulator
VRDSENDAIKPQLLTDQQRAVIDLLHRQSHISTSDVIRSLGTRRRRAQDVLRELFELGLIQRVGAGPNTRYVLPGALGKKPTDDEKMKVCND